MQNIFLLENYKLSNEQKTHIFDSEDIYITLKEDLLIYKKQKIDSITNDDITIIDNDLNISVKKYLNFLALLIYLSKILSDDFEYKTLNIIIYILKIKYIFSQIENGVMEIRITNTKLEENLNLLNVGTIMIDLSFSNVCILIIIK